MLSTKGFRPSVLKLVSTTLLPLLLLSVRADAQFGGAIEGDLTWQTRNDVRIPGNGGTKFDLTDFTSDPKSSFRVYLGYLFGGRHELRALYAPFSLETTGQFSTPVVFEGATYAAGTSTKAKYMFNSYRLTYAYHFEARGSFRWAAGFTGKIRDAEIRLTQGGNSTAKADVGFVPLLNLQAFWDLGGDWLVRADFDGSAAPQGRAIDLGLFMEKDLKKSGIVFIGYRTIEGGADNDTVYNFAWLNKAVVGYRYGYW
jgi:hypothetical protein